MHCISYADFTSIPIPTEEQMIDNWDGYDKRPVVSILCLTYNHRNYIHDALRGILIQKTSFPFEIVIHDDASTDGTSEIIREYQKKYPRIIKTIIQKENQWSQGKHHVILNATHAASGEFLAICDGDDFWISAEKLSLQIDSLRANPECSICFHKTLLSAPDAPAITLPSTKERIRQMVAYPTRKAIIRTPPIIIGDGNYMITTAIAVRKQVLLDLPEWFQDCPVGDLFIQILGSIPGGAVFIPEYLSVYRQNTAGSWTTDTYSRPEKAAAFYHKMASSLRKLDNHLGHKYNLEIDFLIKSLSIYGIYRNYLTNDSVMAVFERSMLGKPLNWIDALPPRTRFILIRIVKNLILAGYSLTARRARTRAAATADQADSADQVKNREFSQP